MYKVCYKSRSAGQAWALHGSYDKEQSVLMNAARIAGKCLMVQGLDPRGNVVWSA
jgi:hypothetical protein